MFFAYKKSDGKKIPKRTKKKLKMVPNFDLFLSTFWGPKFCPKRVQNFHHFFDLKKTCFLLIKNVYGKKKKPNNPKKGIKIWDHF